MRSRRALLVTALLCGCGAPAAVRLSDIPDRTLRDAACAGRSVCQVLETHDAGRVAGEALTVVKTTGTRADEDGDCPPFEWWLVASRGTSVTRRQLLLRVCNDGYGAAGRGADDVVVGANAFEHTQAGGSAWAWQTVRRVSLSPLALVEEETRGTWSVGTNQEHTTWSWRDFRGGTTWTAPECRIEGAAGAEADADERRHAGEEYAYLAIPEVALPAGFAGDGWRDTALGGCAARIGGASPSAGFPLGGSGGEDEATLAAVLSPRGELYVEVRDRTPGARDQVRLWLAAGVYGYQTSCVAGAERAVPVEWVLPVAGRTPPSGVQRHASGDGAVRFRVVLPEGTQALTLILDDAAPGRPLRSIATSRLRPGALASLGLPRLIPADRAVCELRAGRLEPVITQRFDPAHAVLSGP